MHQGGTNNNWILGAADGTNAFTNAGLGQISSNFAGLQTGLSYQWFSINFGYNNV